MQSGEANPLNSQNPMVQAFQRHEDPQQSTLSHTNLKPEIHNNSVPTGKYPTAQEISQAMQSGETPLDFIRRNLKEPQKQTDPGQILQQVQQQRVSEATKPEPTSKQEAPTIEPKFEVLPEKKDAKSEPSKQTDTKAASEKAPDSLLEDADISPENIPAAENFKRLRTKLKETIKAFDEEKAARAALEEENKKFKSGEIVPEILQEKENKIAELSKYEKLVALKTSKEYQQAYIAPLNQLKQKFVDYGKEYGVPEGVMEQALNLTRETELNAFLSDHFDAIGGLEVKQIVKQMQTLREGAKAAEEEPAKEFQRLQEQHQQIETQRRTHARSSVENKARDGWVKALTKIQEEGYITPLLYKENDSDFNERISIPLRTRASQEYGRLVSALMDAGLERLGDAESQALANYVLHATASAINFEYGQAAHNYIREIEQNNSRITRLLRPDIGGSGTSVSLESPQTQPTSPQSAAAAILTNHVLRR